MVESKSTFQVDSPCKGAMGGKSSGRSSNSGEEKPSSFYCLRCPRMVTDGWVEGCSQRRGDCKENLFFFSFQVVSPWQGEIVETLKR